MLALIENDKGTPSTLVFLVFLFFLDLLGKIPLVALAISHPAWAVGFILLYITIGAFWSLAKWHSFTDKAVEKYKVQIADRPSNTGTYKEYLREDVNPANHKSDLVFWMGYWPFSLLWFMIHQPIKRLFNFLYSKMNASYTAISVRALRKANVD